MKIEDIDSNFKPATLGDQEYHFRNVLEEPFAVDGYPFRKQWADSELFRRLPPSLEGKVNDGCFWTGLHHIAGGAVRFRSDSPYIAIRARLADSADMSHMPRAGSAGFDCYIGRGTKAYHVGTAQPAPGQEELLVVLTRTPVGGMQDWTINFPLYGNATKVEIGLIPGSVLKAPRPHRIKKPILFYGSSITQGGCASRPGNCYSSMLCRELDAEQVNLGFSGCGKGEAAMAEAIASLDLAAFVMDYDHNASGPEDLEAHHENFFRIIREKHPALPIVIMTKCDIWHELADDVWKSNLRRRDIIYRTYENAVKAGDKHVYFIDGNTLFGKKHRSACTVDRCHPNDLGFYRMFEAVLPILKKALKEGNTNE